MSNTNNTTQNPSSGWSASHYQIPREPGRNAALMLAGAMHVLLFLFLWTGIHWQNSTPVGVDAEIWDMTTREAAPVPVPVAEVKAPTPPTPEVVKLEPPKPSAEEIEKEYEADLAIERAKEKKIAIKKELEQQQKELQRREDLEREQKKQEQTKIAEQKKLDAVNDKQRADNLKRLTSQVAGTGVNGDAVKSTGNNRVDPGYAGRIAAKIKSNMVYVGADNGADNPTVDFRIDLFPDGSIRGAPHKTKPSGVPAFDDAVERAITKAAPYPADKSGNVPSTIPLTYRLKD